MAVQDYWWEPHITRPPPAPLGLALTERESSLHTAWSRCTKFHFLWVVPLFLQCSGPLLGHLWCTRARGFEKPMATWLTNSHPSPPNILGSTPLFVSPAPSSLSSMSPWLNGSHSTGACAACLEGVRFNYPDLGREDGMDGCMSLSFNKITGKIPVPLARKS